MKRERHLTRSLLALIYVLAACRENPPGPADAAGCIDGAAGCAIEQRQVDHACLHTEAGPFAFVETALAPLPLPELRHTHTAYTLQLVDTPAGHAGSVRLKPRQPAVFAFYSQPDVPIAVLEWAGAEICPVARGAVVGCPRLAAVRAFLLDTGREYVLTLGPVSASTVMVVMEAETVGNATDAALP